MVTLLSDVAQLCFNGGMEISPEFRSFFDSLPEPRILVDTGYRILAANRAYRQTFSGETDFVGRFCYAVSHHYDRPCDQCGESCPLQGALKDRQPNRVLHLHHTPHGEEYVDVELVPLLDAHGEVTAFIERMQFLGERASPHGVAEMVGRSQPFLRMLELINRAAPALTPVLLLGESGTGKELAAQAVHRLSPRRERPFVPVECSGLTESLFESELFGYEKGAFTGANQRKIGLIEHAAGGTLFLDELGDIPLTMQVKLLRLLESGTFRRVGGVDILRADFRLVAATHRDLTAMVEAGTFRRDLYYRIAVFPVHLPPLRARGDDLPALVDMLLTRVAPGRSLRLEAAAMTALRAYPFPGNVRELRNLIERAVLLTDGDTIGVAALALPERGVSETHPTSFAATEHALVQQTLARHGGDRAATAQALGISERTLYRKMRKPFAM
jgi:two-component system, NtrC family, response regulator HydG